jgi:signal transduction histidine kinase
MVLQKRISLALTAVIVLFVAVQGYLAYSSLEQQEDELVDEIVMSETRRLIERIESGDSPLRPDDQPYRLGPNLVAWLLPSESTGAAPSSPAQLPAHLAGLADGAHMLHSAAHVYHAVIEQIAAGRLVVQFDATQNEEFVYRFGRYLIATATLCIALGWAISSVLARIVVAPFRRLSGLLTNWSPGSAHRPVAVSDEETMLLQAFDQAQRRLEESLAREREFAANVRHEVRTPLSALRTDAEMMLLTESLTESGQQRLRRMIAAVDGISSGVDALHALSSAMPGKTETVRLAQCVDDAWESLGHVAADSGTILLNEVLRTDTAEIDRLALMTILRNLLRNAIEHASPGACKVSRTARGLRVADEGPGIAAGHRAFVFTRYFQGRFADSPGLELSDKGLGLAIARQTADLRGWTLEIETTTDRGTAFNLMFS